MKLQQVNLTEVSSRAVVVAAAITGDIDTDVVNQALLLYRQLLEDGMTGKHRTHRLIVTPRLTARLDVNRPWWRFW